jgi:hypothetical protein
MTTKSLSITQQERLTKSLEDQGCEVIRKKNGIMVRLPNGEQVMKHFTDSDVRADRNFYARLRRAGVVHPEDPHGMPAEIPDWIKAGHITADDRKRLIEYVVSTKPVMTKVLPGDVMKALDWTSFRTNRALFHTGFLPIVENNKQNRRSWLVPDDIIASAQESLITVDPTAEEEAEILAVLQESFNPDDYVEVTDPTIPVYDFPLVPEIHDPVIDETAYKEPDIEFLDERDSWVVDLEELLGGTFRIIQDRLKAIEVLGMDYEFRVWRKK